MASILKSNSTRSDIDIKSAFKQLWNNHKLITIENNEELNPELEKNKIFIVGSANVNEKRIGEILSKKQIIATRGPLPARIIKIPIDKWCCYIIIYDS